MELTMAIKPLDEVLAAHDRVDRVHKFWKSLGATDEQAATTAAAHADKFTWNGATLEFQGKPVADPDSGVREWFTNNHLDFLLPPKSANADKPEVDSALLASAKSGNKTAEGQLFRALHGDKPKSAIADTQAALDALLAEGATVTPSTEAVAEKPKPNGSTNPWSAASWDPRRQISAVKGLGVAKASELAKAADPSSFIGATKPGSVNLTSYRRAG
jgi:hypothetical protein